MESGSGFVPARELAGLALEANAVDAAVLVAALRFDEARAVSTVGVHDVRVVVIGRIGGGAVDDLFADEGEEEGEHDCSGDNNVIMSLKSRVHYGMCNQVHPPEILLF